MLVGIGGEPSERAVDVSDLVFDAGLPVLMLPSARVDVAAAGVMVAWRNTQEARRALSAAMPLLRRAEDVLLVCVSSEEGAGLAWEGVEAARARLARHGVGTRADVRTCRGGMAETLLDAAESCGAELIVSGAYGHSRAREWVLGGATRDLLDSADRPLLMMH